MMLKHIDHWKLREATKRVDDKSENKKILANRSDRLYLSS